MWGFLTGFWAEQGEEPLDIVQGLRSYYLLGLDFSRARVWPTVPSIAFTSWTVLTCRHKHLKIFPSAQRRPSHHPIGSLVRPLRSSSCEAVASAPGLSDSARISLVKLEGNMPVFPFRSPSHQPSSTWRRNKNHHFHRPLWGHLENYANRPRHPRFQCFNSWFILFQWTRNIYFLEGGGFVASTSVAYLLVLGEGRLLLFLFQNFLIKSVFISPNIWVSG